MKQNITWLHDVHAGFLSHIFHFVISRYEIESFSKMGAPIQSITEFVIDTRQFDFIFLSRIKVNLK